MVEPYDWTAFVDAEEEEKVLGAETQPPAAPEPVPLDPGEPQGVESVPKVVKRPPTKADPYREKFLKALDSETFQGWDPQKQAGYINYLFDKHPDERVKNLPLEGRKHWVDRLVTDLKAEAEYAESYAGQAEAVVGSDLDPEWIQFYDDIEGNFVARGVNRFGTAAWKGLGAVIASVGTKAQIALEDLEEPEPTGNEILDRKRMNVYNAMKKRKTAEFLQPAVEEVEIFLEAIAPHRELGEKMMEMANRAPRDYDAASIETFMKAEGFVDSAVEATGLTANVIIDSVGIMLPAMAAGTDPATFMAGMQFVHSGLQQEAAKEAGAEISLTDQELSGMVQSALGMVAGPEAWIVGRSGSQFIKTMMQNGFKTFGKRVIAGVGLEGATEFAQEWVNQQVPQWSEENQGFWNNLDEAQQKEVLMGAVLAPLAAGPFEIYGAAKQGALEKKIRDPLKAAEATRKFAEMTPEERGKAGKVSATFQIPDEELHEEFKQALAENAPEFIVERGPEAITQWAEGELSPENEEEREAMVASAMAARTQVLGPDPTQIEVDDEVGKIVLDDLKRRAAVAGKAALDRGDEAAAQRYAAGIEQVTFVEPTDAQEHEWARELQAFAQERGATIMFYDTPGGGWLTARGMAVISQPGVVAVKWEPRAQNRVVAETTFHEMIHNIGNFSPAAERELMKVLEENAEPEVIAEVDKFLDDLHKERPLKPGERERERAAYLGQRYAPTVFRTIGDIDTQEKLAKAPRGMRKIVEWFSDFLYKINQKYPSLAKIIGVEGMSREDLNDRRKVAKIAVAFAKALEVGEARPIVTKPKAAKEPKPAPKPDLVGPLVNEIRVGDTVQITKAIGGKVIGVQKTGDGTAIKLEGGEIHLLPPNQMIRGIQKGAPEAPETAPEPEAPPVVPEEAPEEQEAPVPETPAPVEEEAEAPNHEDYEQGTLFQDDFWHFSVADVGREGLKREFAGTGSIGRERGRLRRTPDGKVDPESAAVHLYIPGIRPEPKVVGKAQHVMKLKTKLKLMDTASPEAQAISQAIMEEGIYGDELVEEFIKRIKADGYDGIVDRARGMAQVYRDIAPEEIEASTPLTERKRRKLREKLPETQMELDELAVEEVEADILESHRLEIEHFEGSQWMGRIYDGDKQIGEVEVTHRFAGTEDEEVFFDWIGVEHDIQRVTKDGTIFGGLGMKGVVALRQQLQKTFPNARWVGGVRVGGAHRLWQGIETIRIPMWTKKQRRAMGGEWVEKTPEELIQEYGIDNYYGYNASFDEDTSHDPGGELDPQQHQAVEALYDDALDDVFLQEEAEADFREHLREDVDDVFLARTEFHDVPFKELNLPEDMGTWESGDFTRYGEHYGVPNLGGMGELVKVGNAELPGGTEGEWTYEELIWIRAQGIDPEEAWTEEEHAEVMRKLGRTLTPSEADPFHAINSLLFSLMSPQLNLTKNEMAFAFLRFQDMDEVAEWVARIPWDTTKGETPFIAEADQEDFEQWKKDTKPKVASPREYYNQKIKFELGLQRKDLGGLGRFIGKFDLTLAAELAQLFQADPEWFLLGKNESWYAFTRRLMSQINGLGTKTAVFGAVWQDPLHAAVAAIDTHMAMIYREAIMGRGDLRRKFEDRVIDKWRKNNADVIQRELFPPENIDDLIEVDPGFVVRELLAEVSRTVDRKYRPKRDTKYIVTPAQERQINRAYKRAMQQNLREAKRLNLGSFATQHLKWDRARNLFEPHAAMFPGLYRLPHPRREDLVRAERGFKELGTVDRTRKKKKGGGYRMERARSAPPSAIALAQEAPSYFAPGMMRSPVYNVQHSTAGGTLDPNSGPMFVIPEESWMKMLVRKIQDKFRPVKELQRAIKRAGFTIREQADVYLHELLYHGRAADRVKKFEKAYVQPLLDIIREDGLDIAEFERYLHARHAQERNDTLKEKWYDRRKQNLEEAIAGIEEEIEEIGDNSSKELKTLKRKKKRLETKLERLENDEIPNSGMTNEEAAQVLVEAGGRFDRAEAAFRRLMDQKMEILLAGGLISQQEYDNVQIYQHYVPLKGKDYDGDLEILLDDIGAGTGLGFDVRGDELGFAYGRINGDEHTHPILSQAVVDIEEAIIRVEKNVVGQAFLDLVQEFPEPELWEVNKKLRRRVWSKKKGEPIFVEDAYAKRQDNVLAVKRDGETFYIYIKDARLASAMKNIGSPQQGMVVRLLGMANRFMAKINTTLNPEFMISNFIRDLQTAMVHLNSKEAEGIALETMSYLPGMLRAIASVEFKDGEGEDEAVYREFQEAGGQIGFFGYNDVISMAKGLDSLIKRQGPGAHHVTFRQIMKLAGLIEAGNTVVENGIRVAAYKAARNNGASKKKAAALARRLTVNFNKKGEWGSTINAVWLFSNASIQGTARMFQAMKSRRVQALVASIVLGNMALSFVNRAVGGDDPDDDTPYYDKVPAWVKETNTVIMLPDSDGSYIKLPMAYGYNVWAVLGQELGDLVYKGYAGQLQASDPLKSAVNFADAAVGAFNPMGSTRLDSTWGVMRFAVPSIVAPIADTLVNETYYGSDIMPTRSSWDKSPASQRHFKNVSDVSRQLADFANTVTGGNAYQPGWADVNPEVLDYLVSSYSGAGPMTAKRVLWDGARWIYRGVRGDVTKPEANDVAFLRRVYGEQNDHTVASVYYENLEGVVQARQAWENLSKTPGFDRRSWRKKYGWMQPLFEQSKKAERQLRKAKDADAKNRVRKRFNRDYRRAWLSQF
jgi:hypothetical protein